MQRGLDEHSVKEIKQRLRDTLEPKAEPVDLDDDEAYEDVISIYK